MSGNRSNRSDRSGRENSARTRAERRADSRRVRALSHLQHVRGQEPVRRDWRQFMRAAKPVAFAVGLLIGGALAGHPEWIARNATVTSISVRGARRLAAADVAGAAGVPRGVAVAAVDTAFVQRNLVAHAWVAAASALQLPSGMLVVGVEERVPAARLAVGEGPAQHLVDAAGAAFALAEGEPALPEIQVGRPPELFAPNADVATAIALTRDLAQRALPRAARVVVADAGDPRGMSVVLESVSPRIVLGRGDLAAKLDKLSRLLATRANELASSTEIDLRFADQAVLRTEPSPEEAAQAAVVRGNARPSDNDPPEDPAV